MKNDSIEELFKKYYNDVLLFTLSLTKNLPFAEEIVSDAFYKALCSADGSIESFKPWLIKVARNLYLNALRKNKQLSELDENIKDECETVLDKIVKDEEYRALLHAISLLKPSEKEVITLFYYQNLSVREIALVIEKSESAVKVTLHRARETLKEILTKNI